jgi:uncharacterized membrane protein YphA (DoxX/SURF4 family)
MLSLFPQLFTYQELAPFILRLAAGLISIGFAYSKLKKPALTQRGRPAERLNFGIGLVQFCAGVLLIAGFLTQLAAGLIILAVLFDLFRPASLSQCGPGLKNYKFMIFLVAVLVALMFLGPGFFSIDLPL